MGGDYGRLYEQMSDLRRQVERQSAKIDAIVESAGKHLIFIPESYELKEREESEESMVVPKG